MKQVKDLTNQVFNRWTVLKYVRKRKSPSGSSRVYWLCRCECGNEKEVGGHTLKAGKSKSCGCYQKEIVKTQKGKTLTKEHREKISKAKIGSKWSQSHRINALKNRPRQDGENNSNWKGGRRINNKGYVYVYRPKHPFARKGSMKGYVCEHRVVMEKKIGRILDKYEIVHHINGIRDDNRISNLSLTDSKNHEKQTFVKILQEKIRFLEEKIRRLS